MIIITHRGIDCNRPEDMVESSYEAFVDHLKKGYGLEFDLQLTKDSHIVVSHDSSFKRLSGGVITEDISEMSIDDFLSVRINSNRFVSLDELLSLIDIYRQPGSIFCIHLKGAFQVNANLQILSKKLLTLKETSHLIFFDVTIESAEYLKVLQPDIKLAPSIVHPYDKERYSQFTQNTLYTFSDIEDKLHLFSHVWLDEWDRKASLNKSKTLYNKELFDKIKSVGLKVCLVSPELHRTSPGLLGTEMHEDARNLDVLKLRLEQILELSPDVICSDYPDMVRDLASNYDLV